MKIAIMCYHFLDPSGDHHRIGGVETYIANLVGVIKDWGAEPIVFQAAETPFEKQLGGVKVIGVKSPGYTKQRLRRDLFNAAKSSIQYDKDILIFGADHVSVRTSSPRCLSIQHGVSWDLPERFLLGGWVGKIPLPPGCHKKKIIWQAKQFFNNCANRVCVDYNFLNWYRTQISGLPEGNIWVIPNFTKLVDYPDLLLPRPWRHPVRILFARRFVEYRGTRIFATAVRSLLNEDSQVTVTFAGEGEDEEFLKSEFRNDPRILFSKYAPESSLEIHAQYDIAVIPSLASEGTALSLAEAMAAGCAVVATNVGGMTNMVIDGYNGLLIPPQAPDLLRALRILINQPDLRIQLAAKALETARCSFGLGRWKSAWAEVLTTVNAFPRRKD